MRIVVFDFDGTLTRKDTFVEFVQYVFGWRKFLCGFLVYAPMLVLMKMRLYPNDKAKEKVFSHFFRSMSSKHFEELCISFCNDNQWLLFSSAVQKIKEHLQANDKVLIITASIENWVIPFAEALGIKDIMATNIEISDGVITGRFEGGNCYGKEKVLRLLQRYPNRESYELVVYGDSKGDKELLAIADEKYYKWFNI